MSSNKFKRKQNVKHLKNSRKNLKESIRLLINDDKGNLKSWEANSGGGIPKP